MQSLAVRANIPVWRNSALLFFSLIVFLGGCATSGPPEIALVRALRPASIQLLDNIPEAGQTLQESGVVLEHSTLVSSDEGLFEIRIGKEEGKPGLRLRYRLPTDARIPIEEGEAVTITAVHSKKTDTGRSYFGYTIQTGEGRWIFALDNQRTLPESLLNPILRVQASGDTVYREGGRLKALCEGITEQRSARFQVGARTFRVTPGQTIVAPLDDQVVALTLIDHGLVVKAQCTVDPIDRLSYMLLFSEKD